MKEKILILYTSVGLGHKSIAKNIGYHLSQNGFEVQLADILQVQEGALVRLGTKLHKYINAYVPSLWKFLYRHGHKVFSPFRTFAATGNYQATEELVREFSPDMIITTQTTASAVVNYLKKKKKYYGLFAVAFSDYHFHPYWMYSEVDLYLANIIEQKDFLLSAGIPKAKIAICGITLVPKMTHDVNRTLLELGMQASDKLILISSGSLGTHINFAWLELLCEHLLKNEKVHVAIIAGKNKEFYTEVLDSLSSQRIHVFAFHSELEKLYQAASVLITKPGGLSLAEAWQARLPVILTHWLPGQEELNFQYVIEKKLAISGMNGQRSADPEKIAHLVAHELVTGELKKMLDSNQYRKDFVQDDPTNSPAVLAIKQAFHHDERQV